MKHDESKDQELLRQFEAYIGRTSKPPSVRKLIALTGWSSGYVSMALWRLEMSGKLVRIDQEASLCYNTPEAVAAMRNLYGDKATS